MTSTQEIEQHAAMCKFISHAICAPVIFFEEEYNPAYNTLQLTYKMQEILCKIFNYFSSGGTNNKIDYQNLGLYLLFTSRSSYTDLHSKIISIMNLHGSLDEYLNSHVTELKLGYRGFCNLFLENMRSSPTSALDEVILFGYTSDLLWNEERLGQIKQEIETIKKQWTSHASNYCQFKSAEYSI